MLLKRLSDALADGDRIRAVVKGSAVNNDGRHKTGFTAPSVTAQSEVIMAAHAVAGVEASSIGMVEAHGTGTPVGDPIEVAALTKAFRESTDRTGYCMLGSAKTNIGHTDTAAGVAGLIKAVLSIEHGVIPANLHYSAENPLLDLAGSPFRVAADTVDWPEGDGPRRAGVSAFGIGGTNAHVVLEQAPDHVEAESPGPMAASSPCWFCRPPPRQRWTNKPSNWPIMSVAIVQSIQQMLPTLCNGAAENCPIGVRWCVGRRSRRCRC